jgi:signal transduction histidine kinase/CheY-like chemotaxis protein
VAPDDFKPTFEGYIERVHPEDRENTRGTIQKSYREHIPFEFEERIVQPDGAVRQILSRGRWTFDEEHKPLKLVGTCQDITERKRAEDELRQSEERYQAANRLLQIELAERKRTQAQLLQVQKMESIGLLAGGIAHDFNNLLTVINGYADLLFMNLEPQSSLRPGVEQMRKSGQRAADLTRQLLAFSRKQILQPRILNLNSLIADSKKMLERLLGEHVELVAILDPDLGQVKADAGQIGQVLLNLAVNARDAMPSGGRLTLETRNESLSQSYAQQHAAVQPGEYVRLSVSDSGIGMNAETMSRIFEPFFTTKEQGTGLGLATVYGIVTQTGGFIWPYSEPGLGTTFKIYLPRVDEAIVDHDVKRNEPASPRGSETILVVEDDPGVRQFTTQALRNYGYDVIEAANAGEALLACERSKVPLPLMVTDLVMPLMSGPDLASRLKQLCPAMKILFMSGYADDTVLRLGLLDTAHFIQKPFSPMALALKVREILDEPQDHSGAISERVP